MSIWQNIFHNKSTKRLRLMLEAVRMRDFSLQYATEKLSGEERRMAEEINAVIREFREVEHRRVGESHFYDALLSMSSRSCAVSRSSPVAGSDLHPRKIGSCINSLTILKTQQLLGLFQKHKKLP